MYCTDLEETQWQVIEVNTQIPQDAD